MGFSMIKPLATLLGDALQFGVIQVLRCNTVSSDTGFEVQYSEVWYKS